MNRLRWKIGASVMEAYGTLIPVCNDTRGTKPNQFGTFRSLDNPKDVVYTLPPDDSAPAPYMPESNMFPEGVWEIYEIAKKTDPYMAPLVIRTTAKRQVEKWTLDADGSYKAPSGIWVWDSGYALHSSNSRTTQGCIRVGPENDPSYLNWLAEKIWADFGAKQKVFIEVYK